MAINQKRRTRVGKGPYREERELMEWERKDRAELKSSRYAFL